MTVSMTIGGRAAHPKLGGFTRVEQQLGERTRLHTELELYDQRPVKGEQVIFTVDGERLFFGQVSSVTVEPIKNLYSELKATVDCVDRMEIADRHLVAGLDIYGAELLTPWIAPRPSSVTEGDRLLDTVAAALDPRTMSRARSQGAPKRYRRGPCATGGDCARRR